MNWTDYCNCLIWILQWIEFIKKWIDPNPPHNCLCWNQENSGWLIEPLMIEIGPEGKRTHYDFWTDLSEKI